MKLITIMYLHESVNRKNLRARNSLFWFNLIASLMKLLHKLDDIWTEFRENSPMISSKWLLR